MANSQVARREVKVARALSRMADHHGGRQPHPSTWPSRYAGPFFISTFGAGDDLAMRYVPVVLHSILWILSEFPDPRFIMFRKRFRSPSPYRATPARRARPAPT